MAESRRHSRETTRADSYEIRRIRPGDLEGFLSLDATVWDRKRSRSWFEWKYVENPYVAEPPVFVVERDGEIVAARPFMAFEIGAGDATRLSLQPADTMVHPDHRRRGLFTRMTEHAIRSFDEGDPAFCFNFPNQRALPGYQKLGWRPAGVRVTHYRVQDPAALAAANLDDRWKRLAGRLIGRIAEPFVRRTGRNDLGPTRDERSLTIDRLPGVFVDLLASLYRRNVPDRLHARRDEQFYRWRFASPVWERTTYVARNEERPVAAVVVRTRTSADGVTITQLAEVVPLVGDARTAPHVRLLDRVLDDYRDSDVIAVADSTIPRSVLSQFGFRRDDVAPLSWVTHRCTLAVRPLGRDCWTVGDRSLDDRSEWVFTYLERDTT